jgi:hypothetical protein
MTQHKISLDSAQLDKIAAIVRPQEAARVDPQRVLAFVQAIALLSAGVWTLYQYMTFQASSDATRLREQELSLRIAESDLALKELEADIKGIERDTGERKLQQMKNHSFSIKVSTSARVSNLPSDDFVYRVMYRVELVNTSESPFTISGFILDHYIGVADQAPVSPFLALGAPANRWNPSSEDRGAVDWKLAATYATVRAEDAFNIAQPWRGIFDELSATRGGGMTGEWRPGQSVAYEDDYIVRAPKGAFIGFLASICFNRCVDNYDLLWKWNGVDLDKETSESAPRKTDAAPKLNE